MTDTLIEKLKNSYEKQLVLLYKAADKKSISYWKSIEDSLEGQLFFGIGPDNGKNQINVYLYTSAPKSDVMMKGVLEYTNWQIQEIGE